MSPAGSASPKMLVGVNSGTWGVLGARDVASAFGLIRWDAEQAAQEGASLSDYSSQGLKAIALLSGSCATCGYSSGGVESINPTAWTQSALAYYQSSCQESTAVCPAIEVLNEPTGSWFWGANAGDQAEASAYGRLLEQVYDAFHAQYGSASPLILGSVWDGDRCANGSGSACVSAWYQEVRAATPNIGDYYDGVVVHPYGGGCGTSRSLSALGNRDDIQSAHSTTGKPVWATEVGWPTETEQSCNADSLQWTETQQADDIYNFVTWARSTGYISAITYFQYRDYSNMWYGLERWGEGGSTTDGSKKPGWYALAESANNQPCTVC